LLVRLRLERGVESQYRNLIGDHISSTLIISEQWVKNVQAPQGFFSLAVGGLFRPKNYGQQIEGLVKFAELMAWPYLRETRDHMENTIANLQAGGTELIDIHDWLFGLLLPGREFRFRIMSCLAISSASTKALRSPPPFYNSGLVLPTQSYWPRRSVLYGIFGGLKDVKALCGWIGPCPPIHGKDKGWTRISARVLKLPAACVDLYEGLRNSNTPETPLEINDYMSRFIDMNEWVQPQINSRRLSRRDVVKLEKVTLQALPRDSYYVLVLGCTEAEKVEHRATLHFQVNGAPRSHTLYTNPCFVTAHPCAGNHLLFKDEADWYSSNVVCAADLNDFTSNDNKFLVITAFNDGEELLARAWCSEHGKHAVVRRKMGCCFTCAALFAGKAGLGMSVLIWS
jgi:hypothetical protein